VSYILLAEDDSYIRATLAELLRDEGYLVFEAKDGTAALTEARSRPPALVLLDLMLPVVDGWDLLRERQRRPELQSVPILVLSAAGDTAINQAESLGASAVLRKPFDLQDVLHEVKRLIGGPESSI
jgi:DNA-binding response OmpR family regulator